MLGRKYPLYGITGERTNARSTTTSDRYLTEAPRTAGVTGYSATCLSCGQVKQRLEAVMPPTANTTGPVLPVQTRGDQDHYVRF